MKKNVKTGVCMRNGVEESFNFYTNLRMVDKLQFVNTVVGCVVGDNYDAIIKDMMFDFTIISDFTDFDISDIMNPDNKDSINMIEDLLDETNIVDIVKANAEEGLIDELYKAVELGIEYRTGIHKNPLIESLSNLLNVVENKVSAIDTDSMNEMANVINGISGEFTPDKFIEAYSKSDLYKQNEKNVSKKTKKSK